MTHSIYSENKIYQGVQTKLPPEFKTWEEYLDTLPSLEVGFRHNMKNGDEVTVKFMVVKGIAITEGYF